jgi:hypothetical protein
VGGAVAATNSAKKGKQPGLNSKQKGEVKSIAKGLVQPGPPGPQGPSGSPGKDGVSGNNGTDGVSPVGTSFAGSKEGHCTEGGTEYKGANTAFICNGAKGTNGTSVVSSPEPPGGNCTKGGSKFVAGASTTFACNGLEGSPWTAGGTLPTGSTETGSWASVVIGEALAPVTFAVPLASELEASNVHKSGEAGFATACPGSAANPTVANNGNLCVYITDPVVTDPPSITTIAKAGVDNIASEGASKAGAVLILSATESYGYGTFAVKGP